MFPVFIVGNFISLVKFGNYYLPMMKKVLIITYYWPPAAGPGVQRWLKFAKYLSSFGIEPIIFTAKNPHYTVTDDDLIKDIPNNIKVYNTRFFNPAGFFQRKASSKTGGIKQKDKRGFFSKVIIWIRANFFIPDAKKFWIRPSVKKIKQIIKEEGIDTIITTGPPHSSHIIGLRLKKGTGIRWIADFRDPWTKIDFFHHLPLTKKSLKKHQKLEKKTLEEADDVICVSNAMANDISSMVKGESHVITNGFDPDDIPKNKNPLTERFTIGHFGTMNSDRNPSVLWEVLKELTEEHKNFKNDLQIVQAGGIASEVKEELKEKNLLEKVQLYDYLPHDKALELEASVRLLLLVMYNTPEGRLLIMGKTFEYMASSRPVLGIGFTESDGAKILKDSESGQMFNFNDKGEIKDYILTQWEKYKNEDDNYTDPKDLEKYSRKHLTERLAKEVILK